MPVYPRNMIRRILQPGRDLTCVVFLLACAGPATAQNYGDKTFYLVDSLVLDALSPEDRELIDTTIRLYHRAAHDTTRLGLIEHIVDECWDDEVWPKYNAFIHQRTLGCLTQSTHPREQQRYASYLAGSISNKGFYYDNSGNVPTALEHYHRSLKIYEKIQDKRGISTSLNNLGVLYSSQGDTSKAFYYHNESLKIKQVLNDSDGISLSLNNIGTIYKMRGYPFEALKCFKQSLKICESIEDYRGIAISYDNIGSVYFEQGFPRKALDYYFKALNIWKAFGENSGLAYSHNNIAEVYLSLGELQQALSHAEKSLAIAKGLGYPMDIQNAARTLSEIKKRQGDFKDALSYYELYISMRDSIFNANTERISMAQGVKYAYEKEALKDSLENLKIQEIKDIQINERDAVIGKEKTFRYALSAGLLLMAILVFVSIRGYQRKKRDNELIQLQKSEVETQKIKLEKQHQVLEETHKEISDSITYARRIQQAILPPRENLRKYLNEGFVWYKPKNVVSGDFYWMEIIRRQEVTTVPAPIGNNAKEDPTLSCEVLVAVADCTGHGVPGAMVSVVCHNALNRSVFEFGCSKPSEILDKTRELVIETFDKSGEIVKDGMDISLCSINLEKRQLMYAGANNGIYMIRDHELREIKADKQPIGRFSEAKPFTQQVIELQKGDCIYLFSDGLADQFGGPKGKKFKYQRLKQLLIDHHEKLMDEQVRYLENSFEEWRGDLEQVDDICVIGVRI
jgi:serine phosphatase RsbU (regulator of sigma subunit)/Tfp pilus assembly protein PilF